MNEKYKDIINLPHHVSEKRPAMSMYDRAAQFSPFAALTGHNTAIDETARLTDMFVEPDESEKQIINNKLHLLIDFIEEKPEITIIFFKPDEKKIGGEYIRATGIVKKINVLNREIFMEDGRVIPIDGVSDIYGKIFDKII